MDGYLTKPIQLRRLDEVLEETEAVCGIPRKVG
jgi:hypothetical protein